MKLQELHEAAEGSGKTIISDASKTLRGIAAKHGLVLKTNPRENKTSFVWDLGFEPNAANYHKMHSGESGVNKLFTDAIDKFWQDVAKLPGEKFSNGVKLEPGVKPRHGFGHSLKIMK
jgi:hypothetical protein